MLEQYLELTQLDRLVDRADYAVIGPTDARTRVVSATRAPYWAVCQVQRDFGDGKFSGCSGFLIAPNIVLTAGHCVFSAARALLKKRATPSRIQIIAGRNGTATPFGVRWAKRWYFPSAFSEIGRAHV